MSSGKFVSIIALALFCQASSGDAMTTKILSRLIVPTVLNFVLFATVVRAEAQSPKQAARDARFHQDVEALFPMLVETRRDIHRHPELGNDEKRTGQLVATRLKELGLEVREGVAGHGIVALLKGKSGDRCVAVRADMDALPITEASDDRPYRSENPGVMHACGHDVHVTAALGVAELLAKHRDAVNGSVKFIFQPAEEALPATFQGDWGAKRMLREKVLENPRPDAIFALHCTPFATPKDGQDAERSGPLTAGRLGFTIGSESANSDRFQIIIKGKMAHGAAPQRGVDSILVAAEAILALQSIRSRHTDTQEPLVLTIGTIRGGTRENILAEQVELGGTVRTYNDVFRDRVIELMRRTIKGVTEAHGATYQFEYRKGYPSVINHAELARRTLPALRRIAGEQNVIELRPSMGGEDFSFFAREVPGFYFRLGVANPDKGITAGLHTAEFDIDEACLKTGVEAMAAAVCDFLDDKSPLR